MNFEKTQIAVSRAFPLLVSMLIGLLAGAAHAQDKAAEPTAAKPATAPARSIGGSWHGALSAGGATLRLVLDVSESGNRLSAVLTSVDQGNVKIPVTSISADSDGARFECAAIAGSFEGKYSADGAEISGTWKQGPNSLPLTFKRQS